MLRTGFRLILGYCVISSTEHVLKKKKSNEADPVPQDSYSTEPFPYIHKEQA